MTTYFMSKARVLSNIKIYQNKTAYSALASAIADATSLPITVELDFRTDDWLAAEIARHLMGEGWTVEIEESEDGTCEQWILC